MRANILNLNNVYNAYNPSVNMDMYRSYKICESQSDYAIRKYYDSMCKNILSRKFMLACIMKACIDEYAECSTEDIMNKYIESEPQVCEELVCGDEQIISDQIEGLNTEDSSVSEGFIRYDIKYKALLPNSNQSASLIINIESQYDEVKYPVMKRAEFYVSRLISSQKNKEFKKSEYENIKKVYSIWIFTSLSKNESSSITEYKTVEFNRIGSYHEKPNNYDFFDIIMIRLGEKEVESNNSEHIKLELIKMLKHVFTNNPKEPKINIKSILKDVFQLNIKNSELNKGVDDMGSISEGIYRRGRSDGIEQGMVQGMLILGADIEKIAELTGTSREKILEIKDSMKEQS